MADLASKQTDVLGVGIDALEVTEEAEAEWVEKIIGLSDRTIEFSENCTPGYYNNEGQVQRSHRQNGFYFGGPLEFCEILASWRDEGSMAGLDRLKKGGS